MVRKLLIDALLLVVRPSNGRVFRQRVGALEERSAAVGKGQDEGRRWPVATEGPDRPNDGRAKDPFCFRPNGGWHSGPDRLVLALGAHPPFVSLQAVFDEIDVPTLQTERLTLRGWRAPDIEPMRAIYADPEVARWLGWPDPAETAKKIQWRVDHWLRHGYGIWAVEERATGTFIGRVGLVHQDDWTASEHDAEVGWTLARASWGHGYATEGARAALDFARDKGLRQIISITRPDNIRSQGVMKRLGLTYRGATHWHDYDQVWYAIDLAPVL